MALRKRLLEEFDNLGGADSPSKSAKVLGLLTSLSPMQAGKYFDGHISDDTTSMRLVGFDTVQQKELATRQETHEPNCHPDNCQIKKAHNGDQMEVLITKSP